jgi:hypothetical protein
MKETTSPGKCSKCKKESWCLWLIRDHGFLCYECKCEVKGIKP